MASRSWSVTPHPADRLPIFSTACGQQARLSQKPFVLDLEKGKKLVDLADEQARGQPEQALGAHFSYLRRAINSGLIGEGPLDFSLQWDQTWVKIPPSRNGPPHPLRLRGSLV